MPKLTKEELQRNKEKWEILIDDWQKSYLSGAEWCRQQGLDYFQFYYWKKHFGKVPVKNLNPSPFIEISEELPSTGIEIICRDVTIRLTKNFDPQALHRCLQLVRSLEC